MHKRDYFLAALRNGAYRYKHWAFTCFSLVQEDDPSNREQENYEYRLYRNENGFYFRDPQNNHEITWLEGVNPTMPAFAFREEIVLGVKDIPNLNSNVTSTYGNLFVNQMVLVWPFGDKIPYMEGRITATAIEKIIEARIKDDPAEGAALDPKAIYVSEYKKYNEAIFALAGFTQLCVPSATPRTMTTDPQVAVRRKELLEKYKDKLHDPVIQAEIDSELIAIDREWIKNDPDGGFYHKAKSFNVVRKKVFLLQGASEGFGVKGELIPVSLNDGWDIRHLPAMSNSLREGSYARGSETMLGGEATKFNYRIFQNTTIAEDDCGSRLGLPVLLTKDNLKHYITNSVITKDGVVELTEENARPFQDKVVLVRSPIYCKTAGANFCACCMGRKLAATPNALSTFAADIGSLFMGLFMSKMHGKALLTADYDVMTAIR